MRKHNIESELVTQFYYYASSYIIPSVAEKLEEIDGLPGGQCPRYNHMECTDVYSDSETVWYFVWPRLLSVRVNSKELQSTIIFISTAC